MFNEAKLDVNSFIYRISTFKERELCTICRALLGFVNSLTKYEHNIIGSDLSINVSSDHKPISSCPVEKGNLSPKNFFFAQMQSTKFKKLRIIYTKRIVFR